MTDSSLIQLNVQQIVEKIKREEDSEKIPALISAFNQALAPLSKDDLSRIDMLLVVGETLYEKGQYKDAGHLLETAAEDARQLYAKGRHALALGLLADLDRVQGNYRSALSKLMKAREVLGENPDHDKDVSARLHIICGLNNMSLGDYESSRKYFYDAYQVYSQIGDVKGKILATNRLGTIHTMLSQFNEAKKYLQESLTLSQKMGDRHAMAGALLNLGEIQRLMKLPREARPFYYEAGALFSALGMTRGIAIAENNLGHIAVQLRDYDVAKYHYTHAIDCARGADLIPDMLDTLAGLVYIFVEHEKFDDAAQLIKFVLSHPAHLQETEEFLEEAQGIIADKQASSGQFPPLPDGLEQVISETLKKVF